ncbi:GntR family phosphonate transport system transcriptional regulator [Sphingobium sp. OAS761]|uniref:phosphonate metabolism transcriptional regulator PhnF n=1 Tax=Sphingobium sp. OAS761 TaxID=2817901 RepID=UPI00209EE32B|nr:phosphonate metabolism transcriptional regulator PhnF [Sphingobium sp. OAS761]MCP1470443.1 GntR family phosphonate transport system transcriptional regulator [Sphingobium sp. OAS761]
MAIGDQNERQELLERGGGIAVWRQIEEALAKDIKDKRFAGGERLPSETELAERFDVNRHTVRRAMLGLAATGLVRVEQGRGTFVQSGVIDYAIGKRTRFTENLNQQDQTAVGITLRAHSLKAEPDIAAHLELPRGALVYQMEVLNKVDDVALAYAVNYYPAARFPDLPVMIERAGGFTAAMKNYGVEDYYRKWSRIGGELADSVAVRHLSMNKQQAILRVENLDVDFEGVPIKYGTTYFAADRVQLLVENDDAPTKSG